MLLINIDKRDEYKKRKKEKKGIALISRLGVNDYSLLGKWQVEPASDIQGPVLFMLLKCLLSSCQEFKKPSENSL